MSWLGTASLLLAHAGLSFLALAMGKHRKHLLPGLEPSLRQNRVFRLGGWLCLTGSLLAALVGYGPGVGLTQWFGLLSCAALLLILQLTYLPRSAIHLSLASLALGLMGLAV